jgi:signal transduction histidine kinase
MVESAINIQTLGIGISAFVATIVFTFLFVNAYREPVARAFGWAFLGVMVWGWFGFFSALAADAGSMELARSLRIVSLTGNVVMAALFMRFAFVYKHEHTPLTPNEKHLLQVFAIPAYIFVACLISDYLLDTSLVIGPFFEGAITPERGPVMDLFMLGYWWFCGGVIAFMMHRRYSKEQGSARRGGIVLMSTIMVAVVTGGMGFAAWYDIVTPIFGTLRALAVPAFAVGAFYAMHSHNIFNVRVAAANIFVFAIWSFLFFRILLNPSFEDSLTDIYLLIALVILGVVLIRSFNKELDDRLLIEHAEKERAVEQAKAEFISIAAHQLRTPLAGVRWTFNVLEAATGLTPDQRELIERANERTKDVIERVNEMLRAARLTDDSFTITLTSQDVRTVLKDCVAMLEGAAEMRKLTIGLELPRKPLLAKVDSDKFGIAIQNLIDNAIKYTKSGTVGVWADRDHDEIVVRVHDTGIGITEEDRKHLFEKFYRNERATKMYTDGSGLGLFIVKKIIDGHNGTIVVESTESRGTSFTIRIPAEKNA